VAVTISPLERASDSIKNRSATAHIDTHNYGDSPSPFGA
jgi:hypothetical protein